MNKTFPFILTAFLPAFLSAAPGDEFWDERFGDPGVDGYSIGAMAIGRGELFVGGTFLSVGSVAATNIARWNGERWTGVGAGAGTGLSHGILDLVFRGEVLYIGGVFTNVGSVQALNVACWDGTNWSSLGSGIPGVVNSLATDGSNVYVGGSFSSAGGIAATNIARWDGERWWTLGNGVKGSETFMGVVDAIVVSTDGLYVGGSFTNASGVNATNVARWDGVSWSAVGEGIPSRVRSLAIKGRTIYAGGDPFRQYATNAVYLSEWNGSTWVAIGKADWPAGGSVQVLNVCGTDLYAGGVPRIGGIFVGTIAKWDGQHWNALGSGITQGGPGDLVCTGSELFVGGQFRGAGGKPATNIALWHIPHSLSISRTENGVALSWPATGTNFILEAKDALNGTSWQPVPQRPAVLDDHLVVTNEMSSGAEFYRLRRR